MLRQVFLLGPENADRALARACIDSRRDVQALHQVGVGLTIVKEANGSTLGIRLGTTLRKDKPMTSEEGSVVAILIARLQSLHCHGVFLDSNHHGLRVVGVRLPVIGRKVDCFLVVRDSYLIESDNYRPVALPTLVKLGLIFLSLGGIEDGEARDQLLVVNLACQS